MKQPKTVKDLEEFGRIQLSKSFFMRKFLYSEISQVEGIANIPDDPELAIATEKTFIKKYDNLFKMLWVELVQSMLKGQKLKIKKYPNLIIYIFRDFLEPFSIGSLILHQRL